MRTNLTIPSLVLAVTMTLAAHASPHAWSGTHTKSFWNNWGITFNGGFTSYFGDLSIYDADPFNKLKHESKPAFGLLLTKFFTDEVGLSGQFIYGGLKSTYNENLSFDTDFIEYNVQLRVDLLNLFVDRNNTGLGLVAFGGIGHLFFNSVKYTYNEGETSSSSHRTSAPEFVYLFGGGVNYSFSDRFSVSMDAALRQVQNDKIDNEVRKDNFDFYSFINMGFTYHLTSLNSKPKKGNLNRARVRMAWH
jgi:hypothetical protein